MAKDKVITVMCATRLPEVLVNRVDAAAQSCGISRAQFIADACRMRLDGPVAGKVVSVGTVQPPDNLSAIPYFQVESTDYAGLERKLSLQALRDICAGNLPITSNAPIDVEKAEISICAKNWWEDGEHYECLMDKGHKEQKHGMRGMFRRLE